MNVIHKAWQWYFWAAAIVIALAVYNFTFKEGFSDLGNLGHLLHKIIFFVAQLSSLLCLFGFAWQVRLGKRHYWVALFFVNTAYFLARVAFTVDTIIRFSTSEAQPFLSAHPELVERLRIQSIGMLLLVVVLFLPMLVANYRNAFHSKHIWTTTP